MSNLERPEGLDSELHNRHGFHKATDVTGPMHAAIRKHSEWLATWIRENTPSGREQSLALTALQESAMWANAAVAINLSPLIEE